MSNALAVATVTQALALLIEHNLHPEIDLAVSVETRKPPADPPPDPTITVFLYQVTHNPSMRNNDLVTRASDGTLLKRPAAAIDLHFLISAYGEETELVGQRLIGSVVRTLHEIPVLPQELIEEAVQRPYLAGSDLAEALQRVRFTPTQMDVDETSKLWGMFNNTPYALSVVYQASLVLLDGHEEPRPAKPVRRPEVTAVPFGAPGAPRPPTTTRPPEAAPERDAAEAEPEEAGAKAPKVEAAEAGEAGARGAEARPLEGQDPQAAPEAKAGARGGPKAAAKKAAGGTKSAATRARSGAGRSRKTTGRAAPRDGDRAPGAAGSAAQDGPGSGDDGKGS
ncbi:DUF4255 domain-containing protein [Streptomyces sp. NPDC056411]|uniref:DUF4255 domain-containing protein n=1 Tax=Streptomyces sp. NPDC056411 TaxID=3345813 RepID=UPI0035D9FC40